MLRLLNQFEYSGTKSEAILENFLFKTDEIGIGLVKRHFFNEPIEFSFNKFCD